MYFDEKCGRKCTNKTFSRQVIFKLKPILTITHRIDIGVTRK